MSRTPPVRTSLMRALRALAVFVMALASGSPALAIAPNRAISQLHHTGWSLKDGAPQDGWHLARTSDGMLWIGTPTGLFSFDGIHFERFRAGAGDEMKVGDISSLYAARDGGLWVGMKLGGAYFVKDGRVTSHEALARQTGSVMAIAEDGRGRLWAGTTRGLFQLENGEWKRLGPGPGSLDSFVSSMLVDREGVLWTAGPARVAMLDEASGELRSFPLALTKGFGLSYLAQGRDGSMWLSHTIGGVHEIDRERFALGRHLEIGNPIGSSTKLLADRDGVLWLVADHLYRLFPEDDPGTSAPPAGTRRPRQERALAGQDLTSKPRAILEDADGTVWVSTVSGLDRFRTPKLMWHPPLNAGGAVLMPGQGGTVWMPWSHGIWELGGERPRKVADFEGDHDWYCASLDRAGAIWLADREGLMRYEGGRGERVPLPAGAPQQTVLTMGAARDGSLWLSQLGSGLFQRKDGAWLKDGGLEGLPKTFPTRIVDDGRRRMWIGYDRGQAVAVEEENGTARARVFGAEQGLSVGNVQDIAPDQDDAWVGGPGGLAWFSGASGRFRPVKGEGDERFEGLSGITRSDDGALWLLAASGILRVDGAEVAALRADPSHAVRFERFDHLDGLQGIPNQFTRLPSLIKAENGRLFFMTSQAVYWLDPANLGRNAQAPSLRIRAVSAHGRSYDTSSPVALPEGSTQLEVQYAVLNASLPEKARYRYMLEGVDRDWRDAGDSRIAHYTNLGPGDYRFRVLAANEDGVWNEEGATMPVNIAAAFWQTNWFRILVLLLLLALAWAAHRYRVEQAARQLRARLEARTQERERIARELHDTLLQSNQGLVLSLQALADLPAGQGLRDRLSRLVLRADQALAETRSKVTALRELGGTGHELPAALAFVGEEATEGQSSVFHIEVAGTPRPVSPLAFDEVLRIATEALRNAAAHAQATSIALHVEFDDDALRIRIEDDGKGIDETILARGSAPGHWGLQGMRERAAALKASLRIERREPAGTTVGLEVPAKVAFSGISAATGSEPGSSGSHAPPTHRQPSASAQAPGS